MNDITGIRLDQGLQTTARGSNPAYEDILSIMKKTYIYENFIDLVERNISQNNVIT